MIVFTANRSLSQLPAVGQVIILPSYDLPEEEKVCRLFEQLFPSFQITSIDSRQIAREGGGVELCELECCNSVNRNTKIEGCIAAFY